MAVNVPITGAYNIENTLEYAQILATRGKRTSVLKQAKMLAAITKRRCCPSRTASPAR